MSKLAGIDLSELSERDRAAYILVAHTEASGSEEQAFRLSDAKGESGFSVGYTQYDFRGNAGDTSATRKAAEALVDALLAGTDAEGKALFPDEERRKALRTAILTGQPSQISDADMQALNSQFGREDIRDKVNTLSKLDFANRVEYVDGRITKLVEQAELAGDEDTVAFLESDQARAFLLDYHNQLKLDEDGAMEQMLVGKAAKVHAYDEDTFSREGETSIGDLLAMHTTTLEANKPSSWHAQHNRIGRIIEGLGLADGEMSLEDANEIINRLKPRVEGKYKDSGKTMHTAFGPLFAKAQSVIDANKEAEGQEQAQEGEPAAPNGGAGGLEGASEGAGEFYTHEDRAMEALDDLSEGRGTPESNTYDLPKDLDILWEEAPRTDDVDLSPEELTTRNQLLQAIVEEGKARDLSREEILTAIGISGYAANHHPDAFARVARRVREHIQPDGPRPTADAMAEAREGIGMLLSQISREWQAVSTPDAHTGESMSGTTRQYEVAGRLAGTPPSAYAANDPIHFTLDAPDRHIHQRIMPHAQRPLGFWT